MKKILTAIIAVSLAATATLYGCSKKQDTKKEEKPAFKAEVSQESLESFPELKDPDFPFEYKTSRKTAEITGYFGEETDVVIPSEIVLTLKNDDGVDEDLFYAVDTIADYAFLSCEGDFEKTITSIVIPEGVTTIGAGAFQNCTSIESITLPSTLTSIGDKAFYNCINLKEVIGGENLTSIGREVFGDSIVVCPWFENQSEKAVFMGDGIMIKYNNDEAALAETKHVVPGVFKGCTAESLTFSDKLVTLPTTAFDEGYETKLNISASSPFITNMNATKGAFVDANSDENKNKSDKELLKAAIKIAYPTSELYGALIIGDGNLLEYNDDAASLAKVKSVSIGAFIGCTAESVTFSEKLENIAAYSFSTGTETIVYIPSNCPFASADYSHVPNVQIIQVDPVAPEETEQTAEDTPQE